MCWLFVVKVLLMWDYIRLHHYYISKYSIHQRWVYCWLNNEQYVDSLLWKFWSFSNYIMLTWDIRLSLCVHVLEKESMETRVLFRLNIIRYSSHIPECTVLTSTRMKNHTWVYCSHKYTYEEPYLSVLFSQVHVWRTIQQTLATSVLPCCIRVLENGITIVKFLRYAIASYPDLYTPCSTKFSETCNLQWCTLDIRRTSGAVQVVD